MVYFNSNPNFMLSIYIGGYDVLLAEETRLPQEKHQKNVVLNTINLNLVLMNKLLFQKQHNSVIETKSDYIRDYLFM
jgi:hypothetical protein